MSLTRGEAYGILELPIGKEDIITAQMPESFVDVTRAVQTEPGILFSGVSSAREPVRNVQCTSSRGPVLKKENPLLTGNRAQFPEQFSTGTHE